MKKVLQLSLLMAMTFGVATMASCEKKIENTLPPAPEYSVRATADEGGAVAVAVEGEAASKAVEGDEVTLTATPAEGWLFDKWVTVKGGVIFTDAEDNPVTFTMPAADVEFKAVFTPEVVRPETYSITLTNDGNGTATADREVAEAGTEITITATPAEGYAFSRWTVISGGLTLSASTIATFDMPAQNVEIKAEFVEEVYNGFDFIADPAFLTYCQDFDTDADGILSRQEAADVTFIYAIIDPDFGQTAVITSLEGVEIFTNLELLDCIGHELTEIDVSANVNLQELYCSDNRLTSLIVNSNLTLLACENNNLTSLDVSYITGLKNLNCSSNSLTSLDVSNLVDLYDLACNENDLTSLIISNTPALRYFACLYNNLNISVIRAIISDLPTLPAGTMRFSSMQCRENPGCADVTQNDVQAAKDKQWNLIYQTGGIIF